MSEAELCFSHFVDQILKELLLTGVYGENWPSHTYLTAVIKHEDGTVLFKKIYESIDEHAEFNMVNDDDFKGTLKAIKREKFTIDIIVTSNYSPCRRCADRLKSFYEKYKAKICHFIIRFSFPYLIQSKENKIGLYNLKKAGITLEAMTEKSWFDVIVHLMLDGKDPEKIRQRDKDTKRILTGVLTEQKKQEEQEEQEKLRRGLERVTFQGKQTGRRAR